MCERPYPEPYRTAFRDAVVMPVRLARRKGKVPLLADRWISGVFPPVRSPVSVAKLIDALALSTKCFTIPAQVLQSFYIFSPKGEFSGRWPHVLKLSWSYSYNSVPNGQHRRLAV
jgi:hypothetical protein